MARPLRTAFIGLFLVACRSTAPQPAEPTASATNAPLGAASAPSAPASASAEPAAEIVVAHELGAMPAPSASGSAAVAPSAPAVAELGHQLFFDKRLSVDGSRACYSCHLNEDGTGGHDPLAVGAKEKPLTRHSPALWNVGYHSAFYWDGRAASLEAQATAAWAGGNMGVGKDGLEKKAKELAKIAGYKAQFDKLFPGKGLTPETVVAALAAYERTLVCSDTRVDKYARGEKTALDDQERRGLALFTGKAMCVACHAPPHYSSAIGVPGGTYFNVGVGVEGKPEKDVDVGRQAVTKADADWAAFKVPTLRNVGKSAPYFHDGSVAKLEDAVRLMAGQRPPTKGRSPLIGDRGLSDAEVADVVAFLRALDCPGKLEEPKLP